MIRTATIEDTADVVRIMNHGIEERRNAYLTPFLNDEGENWFKSLLQHSFYLVVKEDNDRKVCGWGSLTPYRSGRGALLHVAETTFYFDLASRGKGWGVEMLSHLEAAAMDMEKRYLVAILLDDNVPSKALLRKLGYNVWANFEGLAAFPDGNRGHMYMGKHLG
ncbi:MAG: GNAT family N-acetyltransferase [Flavobacteriales bacterium]|nr:GNAT family N-acetyltransferase [Flavobacteriales bacterium]